MDQKIGSWAFIIGVVLAIITGLLGATVFGSFAAWLPVLFIILGFVVGFLNITDKETTGFLVAVIALLVAGGISWASIPMIGVYLAGIFGNIASLLAPAAVIVGLKTVWNLARPM